MLFTLAMSTLFVEAREVIDLTGRWDFHMGDETASYDDSINLPGSMLTRGKGNPVNVGTLWTSTLYDSSFFFNPFMEKYRHEGRMKFPFFLTPARHYVGWACYRRRVEVPTAWRGKRVSLFLERPHIETTLVVNGQQVGHRMSLSAPHQYDVTSFLDYGAENTVELYIYNGIENVCVGQDSHSVTDQTQGNWNGVVGRMEMQARPMKGLEHLRLFPEAKAKRLRVEVATTSSTSKLQFLINQLPVKPLSVKKTPEGASAVLPADVTLWDEFHPNVHTLQVIAPKELDTLTTTFGLRDINIQGRQFLVNGNPVFLRGTVENCCFPLTGYPPTDAESWRALFGKCKEFGLNHVRFHSYCPPDVAFTVADELGLYLQPEGPSWPNHGVKLRSGMPIDQYLLDEGRRILDTYGHHPSFVMMAAGNEPAGNWVGYCNDWVKAMHEADPTRVYCGASVGGGWAWDNGSEYHVKGGARGLDWDRHRPHADDHYFDQIEFPRNYCDSVPNRSPILSHEQGQWCAFPDLKERSLYTGAYKAGNYDIFADLLEAGGMASQAEKFLMASGRLQVLAYKYEMERNLRTPDYAGFQLLGLNDYSGQGTALVGPLNVFWKEKGYVTAAEWREFCSPLVPLARMPKFVFTTDERLQVPVELYNATASAVADAKASYAVTDASGQVVAEGALSHGTYPVGKNIEIGEVALDLSGVAALAKLTLTVALQAAGREVARNHWDFWVYPAYTPSTVAQETLPLITDTLDERALAKLRAGGSVLITAGGKIRYGADVRHMFLPVFWNTSWFKMRPPHTTGAYIDASHPMFRQFPTDSWQDLQWWELTNRTQVMNLAEFPKTYQPPVQPIDTWHVSRKLAMVVEARVLGGRLLMTTFDLTRQLDRRPVARQLRQSILNYMQSTDFQPSIELAPEVITHLFEHTAPPVNMFTNDSPDELKPKIIGQ